MPRGQRKKGAYRFTIWFEDGSRIEWNSRKPHTNPEIADAIDRYLKPLTETLRRPTRDRP